jgi:hypothetical protein
MPCSPPHGYACHGMSPPRHVEPRPRTQVSAQAYRLVKHSRGGPIGKTHRDPARIPGNAAARMAAVRHRASAWRRNCQHRSTAAKIQLEIAFAPAIFPHMLEQGAFQAASALRCGPACLHAWPMCMPARVCKKILISRIRSRSVPACKMTWP